MDTTRGVYSYCGERGLELGVITTISFYVNMINIQKKKRRRIKQEEKLQ